ncbi:GTP-binding protein [Acinetobacter sp. LoGeW2-3]|uniref:GTP-binding protein n=1 Tax=Acinetobacter sp. LoGeW2-3 TaxID=1808001 RepID=UPI000C05CA2D|nr:ATP/GTP-binding protein [Acinetobacter sp. LoGeW2-3]ATO20383.1 GTP-binding protein [Acinetobacter sp. LoGeW2-3]
MILHQFKLVFAGSMGAGKTTAIRTISNIDVLSTEAINTDLEAHQKSLTTVGIDYGELVLEDGIKVGLYGTPGQQRFDFIWNVITQGAIGVILLIDDSIDEPLQELEFYLDYFKDKVKNVVIGITHIDKKAKNNAALYHDWAENQDCIHPMFFIDAREKNDVLMLVDALIAKAEVQLTA